MRNQCFPFFIFVTNYDDTVILENYLWLVSCCNNFFTKKYLLPSTNGVYITKTKVKGKVYKSITNIGYNPTVSDGKDKKFIETHILDFDEDIYDEKIEVFFYEFLRKEQKFESFNHLKEQLQKDKKKCEEKDI